MNATVIKAVVGIAGFMVLDGVWLGLVMKTIYRDQLAPVARLSNGGFAPNWPAAMVVYVLLGLGIAIFVMPRVSSASSAAGFGALFGLVVYGVYDFTNFSTLKEWPLPLTFIDVGWGAFASALCAVVVWTVAR